MKHEAPSARGATIESKDTFIQVGVEVRMSKASLVCAQSPTFHQCNGTVDSWQQGVRVWVVSSPNIGLSHWFVHIPFVCQTAITCESVGYTRPARLNMLLNDMLDIRARPALQRLHSHSPTSFVFDVHGNANTLLVSFSTPLGFINFNVPGKTVAGGATHRNPSLMQHEPRRLVTAHPQHPLPVCALAPFFWLVNHQIA